MSNTIFYSTDDNVVEGTVKVNGVPVVIASGSTVIAFVQDTGTTVKILNDITILEGDTGNDWPNGVIRGLFSDVNSAILAQYNDQKLILCVRITTGTVTQSYVETITAGKLL